MWVMSCENLFLQFENERHILACTSMRFDLPIGYMLPLVSKACIYFSDCTGCSDSMSVGNLWAAMRQNLSSGI